MSAPRPVSWFSVSRSPRRTLVLGVGLGKSRGDRTFCVILQLVVLFVAFGPHYTPDSAIMDARLRRGH